MNMTPKTEQVLTTVTPQTLSDLDAYADQEQMSRAAVVRRFIVRGLATSSSGDSR